MIVRPATYDDIPELLKQAPRFVELTPYAEFGCDIDSIYKQMVRMIEADLYIVSEANGKLLGSVGGTTGPLMTNNKILVAYENWWWIEPEARRGGAGSMMLDAYEAQCRNLGAQYNVMLALATSMPEVMRAVYEARGYSLIEFGFAKRL